MLGSPLSTNLFFGGGGGFSFFCAASFAAAFSVDSSLCMDAISKRARLSSSLNAATCSTNPDGSESQANDEVCANSLDDDCDGATDESPCQ